jgi:hypothetical protein
VRSCCVAAADDSLTTISNALNPVAGGGLAHPHHGVGLSAVENGAWQGGLMSLPARKYAVGRPTADDAAAVPVLAAVWCRSVGTSWTLELHELADGAALGTIMDWISSGVPISQPEPDALAGELLAERGLQLFRNSYAGPCTRSRRGIGYVCRDAELVKLASVVRDDAAETGVDPVVLASRWVAAGFSADAAGGWIREGVHSPQVAQQTVR